MKCSRLVTLLLCLLLFAPGCQYIPQSMSSFFQPQKDEAASWLANIATLSPEKQGLAAEEMWRNSRASATLRERALSVMASRPGSRAAFARGELSQIYARADTRKRSSLESAYWADLDGMDIASMRAAVSSVAESEQTRFPWNLLLLKAARRGIISSPELLSRVSAPNLYANPALLGLKTSALAPQSGAVHVALVLPLSGKGSAQGRKIQTGAEAAADMLKNRGAPVDILAIDVSAADWASKIQALPVDFTVIGGLIPQTQTSAFKKAATGRAPFVFIPSLPTDVAEGTGAWRFFASPEDQVSCLLNAADSLGIRSAGVFSPEDAYSKRMNAVFQREAQKHGITVAFGSYELQNVSSWPKAATAFLKTRLGTERGSIPQATAGFQAIFLPDSWKNMDMLISSLHYGGAHNMLMMGSSLWEQSLDSKHRNNAATFSLTVFPANWNKISTAPGAESFRSTMSARGADTDDWSALGFDFVQTVAALKLAPGWTAAMLNSKLSALRLDWAGAPFSWDGTGKARRALFLMRPASVGSELVDLSSLRARYENGSEAPTPVATPQTPASTSQSLQELLDSIPATTE